jgi:hypothetical protein
VLHCRRDEAGLGILNDPLEIFLCKCHDLAGRQRGRLRRRPKETPSRLQLVVKTHMRMISGLRPSVSPLRGGVTRSCRHPWHLTKVNARSHGARAGAASSPLSRSRSALPARAALQSGSAAMRSFFTRIPPRVGRRVLQSFEHVTWTGHLAGEVDLFAEDLLDRADGVYLHE